MQENLNQYLDRRKVAEEMRLMIKHQRWALQHMENIYNLCKAEDQPTIQEEDPDQFDLFTQKTKRQDGHTC